MSGGSDGRAGGGEGGGEGGFGGGGSRGTEGGTLTTSRPISGVPVHWAVVVALAGVTASSIVLEHAAPAMVVA